MFCEHILPGIASYRTRFGSITRPSLYAPAGGDMYVGLMKSFKKPLRQYTGESLCGNLSSISLFGRIAIRSILVLAAVANPVKIKSMIEHREIIIVLQPLFQRSEPILTDFIHCAALHTD